MAKVRRILGHVEVVTAGRKRKCNRNKAHVIAKGDACLAIRGGTYNSAKGYCWQCAQEIVDQAVRDLAEIRRDLAL